MILVQQDKFPTKHLQRYEHEITQLLLDIVDVTEDNGLKFPREFGLLVKQSLYFDRYLKILSPALDAMSNARVGLGSPGDVKVNGNALELAEIIIEA